MLRVIGNLETRKGLASVADILRIVSTGAHSALATSKIAAFPPRPSLRTRVNVTQTFPRSACSAHLSDEAFNSRRRLYLATVLTSLSRVCCRDASDPS